MSQLLLSIAVLCLFLSVHSTTSTANVASQCNKTKQRILDSYIDKRILHCPTHFDFFHCWGPIPVNSTQYLPCPPQTIKIADHEDTINKKPQERAYASRICNASAMWANNGKTDYSLCLAGEAIDADFRAKITIIYLTGNSISLVSLCIAIGIFLHFRKLMCLRNKIHIHFFFAIAIRILTYFLLYAFRATSHMDSTKSASICYLLTSITHFSGLAKYLWMLAEGLYLVLVIIWTFGIDRLKLWNFGIFVWGISFLLTCVWLIVRILHKHPCRAEQSGSPLVDWFINGPILVSLFINFCIAIYIAKTLLTKMRETQRMQSLSTRRVQSESGSTKRKNGDETTMEIGNDIEGKESEIRKSLSGEQSRSKERRRQFLATAAVHKKAMKSVLILIPLLGLTYLVLLYPPHESFKRPWAVLNAILSSTQGFFVALLFCFLNHEVQAAISTARNMWRDRRGFDRYGRSQSMFGDSVIRRQSSCNPRRMSRMNS